MTLLEYSKPISDDWDFAKNHPLTPADIPYKKNIRVFWICSKCGYNWSAFIYDRTVRGTKCRQCRGSLATPDDCFAVKRPELVQYWNYSKNQNILPTNVKEFSHKEVWWKCSNGHEWQAPVARISNGHLCRFCGGKEICEDNNFAYRYPELLKEWDFEKNILNPYKIFPNITDLVWWKCKNGHSYQTQLVGKVQDQSDCGKCLGRVASPENNLFINYPELMKEWDPENTINPKELSNQSGYRAKWICSKNNDHKWEANVYSRTRGYGCNQCAPNKNTDIELILQKLFDVPGWNRRPSNTNLKCEPDIKLSDSVYINSDGLYYHTLEHKPDKYYHFKLYAGMKEHGLRLFQFYADEIYNKPHIIKGIVDSVLNKNTKIGARKLLLETCSKNKINEFLNNNHLLGPGPSSKNISLTLNNEVLMTCTFKKHKTFIEITRVCSKIGITVQGGLSRLINCLKKIFPGKNIVTQTDNRYADGHSLEKLGFVQKRIFINYQYTNSIIRENKRKHRVPAGINEEKEAVKKGFYKIYDAKKITWILKT